ncbi:MAG: cation-translocating P-type ATPase [Gemmatimonas sp.]
MATQSLAPHPQVEASSAEAWHALSDVDVLSILESNVNGLTSAEAASRLKKYGANVMPSPPGTSAWQMLASQCKSVVVALLVVAMGVALATGDLADAGAIGAVLLINVSIGFVTEWRARRAMTALLGLDVLRATVLRDGVRRGCDAIALVPGDIVDLEEGQLIPADARLLSAAELRVDEAVLTGESLPSHKRADQLCDVDAPLSARTNIVFKSTMTVAGHGRAVVIATGALTEVGRIDTLVRDVAEPRTPLEKRLDELGRQLIWVALAAASVVAAIFALRGTSWRDAIETGIALAVAAVPEGLPAIATIAMAVGVWRMARRHAIVRRLPVVETLGAATVICTDKTGTVTTGEMAATSLWIAGREYEISGVGYKLKGEIRLDGESVGLDPEDVVPSALRIAALANRAEIRLVDGRSRVHGDPTEIALLVAAEKGGVHRDEWRARWPEIAEIPFSSERKFMATMHRHPDGSTITMVKGAPETLLARSTRIVAGEGIRVLDDRMRATVEQENERFASRGLRVLALAFAARTPTTARPDMHPPLGKEAPSDLTFAGLIGVEDAPVPGIDALIQRFRDAGIRTLMLTGDQRLTASAIATRVGILDAGETVIDAERLPHLTDAELRDRLVNVGAVSRVSPADKLRVVRALQADGQVVAMIGDGVNDAPALKNADIGIAMGGRGTDVAKDAADIVLQDDRLETVGAAIEEGRVIYDNIQKAVVFLFSTNIAEVMVLLLAGIAALPPPLLPLQILWLNLVTDTFPAIALALEPARSRLMRAEPRRQRAPILSRAALGSIALSGALITAASLAAYVWARGSDEHRVHASTIAWMTLALSQLLHVGNVRSDAPVTTAAGALGNVYAIGAVLVGIALQLLAVQVPSLARALLVQPLSLQEWMVVIALAVAPAIIGQLWRLRPGRTTPSAGVRP